MMRQGVWVVVLFGVLTTGVTLALAQGTTSVRSGVYTTAQAKRGELLYLENCASCHSETLAGMESAPPLIGESFMAALAHGVVRDLLEKIRTTMPLDSPGRLSRQRYVDILAYVLAKNDVPSGPRELPVDEAVLGTIVFK